MKNAEKSWINRMKEEKLRDNKNILLINNTILTKLLKKCEESEKF